MIASIIVGSGNKRTKIDLPTSRDERVKLGNKIKSLRLFPTQRAFNEAKARGNAAATTVGRQAAKVVSFAKKYGG